MQVQVLSSAPGNGSRSKNAFDLLFFTSTAMSCSDSRAKYSQGQRAVCPEQFARPVLVVPLTQERTGRLNGEKKSEGLLRLLAAYV